MMKNIFKIKIWSPLVVGALIGTLLAAAITITGKILGSSKAITTVSGLIQYFFAPTYTVASAYFSKYLIDKPIFDFQLALVIGVFLGAWVATLLAGRQTSFVPALWQQTFGPSKIKRGLGAFIGGILVIWGARLAGGCTSGLVISGGSRLGVAGWVFALGLFASGILTAHLMYRSGGAQ